MNQNIKEDSGQQAEFLLAFLVYSGSAALFDLAIIRLLENSDRNFSFNRVLPMAWVFRSFIILFARYHLAVWRQTVGRSTLPQSAAYFFLYPLLVLILPIYPVMLNLRENLDVVKGGGSILMALLGYAGTLWVAFRIRKYVANVDLRKEPVIKLESHSRWSMIFVDAFCIFAVWLVFKAYCRMLVG